MPQSYTFSPGKSSSGKSSSSFPSPYKSDIFSFPKIKMSFKNILSKEPKASRKYRYTPSFGALIKGEKFKLGEFTTKKFTGLEYRGSLLKSTKKKKKI